MALPYCLDVGVSLCYTLGMKQRSSFRLSSEAMQLLAALARANGISMTAVLELAIREMAKRQRIHADTGVQSQGQQKPAERD